MISERAKATFLALTSAVPPEGSGGYTRESIIAEMVMLACPDCGHSCVDHRWDGSGTCLVEGCEAPSPCAFSSEEAEDDGDLTAEFSALLAGGVA